ncbi:hypothetical protein HWV62_40824 [Athelia sp. TMB]|nr:hypothetical protein HWV62_40824 [Athelia sp. TMB]
MPWFDPIPSSQVENENAVRQWQPVYYFMIATIAAYVWDWILSLGEEYEAFAKSRFRLPNIVYAVSRVGSIAYSICVVSGSMKKGELNQWLFFVAWSLWEVSALGTYGLFFIRVCAVYQHSKKAVFLETPAPFYDGAATIIPAINDTLIFFCISFRLAKNSYGDERSMGRTRTFFTGYGLRSRDDIT